jgi:hypothetical protein
LCEGAALVAALGAQVVHQPGRIGLEHPLLDGSLQRHSDDLEVGVDRGRRDTALQVVAVTLHVISGERRQVAAGLPVQELEEVVHDPLIPDKRAFTLFGLESLEP